MKGSRMVLPEIFYVTSVCFGLLFHEIIVKSHISNFCDKILKGTLQFWGKFQKVKFPKSSPTIYDNLNIRPAGF